MNEQISEQILQIVRERQRNVPAERGVLPRTVQCFLDEYRAEQTLRRDMATLWRMGKLERVGEAGSRRGYRVLREGTSPKHEVQIEQVQVKLVRPPERVPAPRWIQLPPLCWRREYNELEPKTTFERQMVEFLQQGRKAHAQHPAGDQARVQSMLDSAAPSLVGGTQRKGTKQHADLQ